MVLTPDSNGEDNAPIREFNPCHSAKDGKFCATKGSGGAAILKGVDSAANLDSLRMMSPRNVAVEGRSIALTEAALRALPLVHGTTIDGAVAAATEGLKAYADMEDTRRELAGDIADLREQIGTALGLDAYNRANLWDVLTPNMEPSELEDAYELTRDAAKDVQAQLSQLASIERIVEGKSFAADKAAGLDKFVFTTHGDLHQDYGPLGVVIDNTLIDGGWATPKDIVSYSGGMDWDETKAYTSRHLAEYKSQILIGDDYYKGAAVAAGSIQFLTNRSREHLWEIKVARVPKSAVRGFVVHDDIDLAIALRDRLAERGITGKVLYISEPGYGDHRRWYYHQMKHVQKWGTWDKEHAAKRNETGGGGEIFVW